MRPDDTPEVTPTACAGFASPVGPLTATATETGLLRLEFAGGTSAAPPAMDPGSGPAATRWLAQLGAELSGYFDGDLQQFTVPLDWSLVTGARRQVLATLYRTVGYGQTTSYGQLAAASGRPGAARLVGTVMGSNPIPIVVPCHRVLAGDGSLGGYGPGVPLKRQLLELEGALPTPLPAW